MASLTTKINDTTYGINFTEGTISFNPLTNTAYYGRYNSRIQHKQNVEVLSPPLNPNEIYLNDFGINQDEHDSTEIDTIYYDGLRVRVADYEEYGNEHNYIYPIPRTYYIEKEFNTSTTDTTIILFNSSLLKFWSEIEVKILDVNNEFVEPYSISIVNGICSISVPPYEAITSSFIDGTLCRCRLYFYNIDDFVNNIEFNETYSENSAVNLRPMNYILWLKNNCIKFSNLVNYEIHSPYVNGTARKLEEEIDTILEYAHNHLGEVGIINLNLSFDDTNQALIMNVTVLDADIPQLVGIANYYNPVQEEISSQSFDIDSYIGYYTTDTITADTKSFTCTINYNNDSYNIVYTYDDVFNNADKIGNGIDIINNHWCINNVCNLGVHLG